MLLNSGFLVGTKDGFLSKVNLTSFKEVKRESKTLGWVTSMALTAESSYIFYGTENSNIYWVETSTLNIEIRNTCHSDRKKDVQFPYEHSGVVGTCGKEDISIL